MANIFDYIFNLKGNYQTEIRELTEATEEFEQAEDKAQRKAIDWSKTMMGFDAAVNVVRNAVQGVTALSQAGVSLDSQMHDLSAVAGVFGDDLKTIEGYARESAKAFGTDASEAVTGYKLLLSQLSPELGKYPEALKAMGNNIQTTAKLMGGDGVAAAEVLTTAMNQYGVSLDDPMKASEEMARMMNVMAAAGQAGSAELPAIKVALEQCGMAAKAAGVSFEETNAAIQVLDKAGKKGSEGGVALRNVMATLAQGRFLPKDVQKELSAAGVDVIALGDKSKSLKERLEMLKPVMQDSALFSKLFGRENANAALALVGGTEALGNFTEAVTDTKSAEEQAQIVMDSYEERQTRVRQKIDDLKISLFQATGDFTLWASNIGESLIPLSQLMPLLTGVGKLVGTVLPAAISVFRSVSVSALTQIYALIIANPIGAIAAAVVALGIALVVCWKKFAGFRAFLITTWQTVKDFAGILKQYLIDRITGLLSGIGKLGEALAKLFKGDFKGAWAAAKTAAFKVTGLEAMGNAAKATGRAANAAKTNFAQNLAQERAKEEKKEEKPSEKKAAATGNGGLLDGVKHVDDEDQGKPSDPTAGTLGNVGGGSSGNGGDGGSKIRNITINVDRLVERLEVHAATVREGADRVKELVTEALLGALNDVNLAV